MHAVQLGVCASVPQAAWATRVQLWSAGTTAAGSGRCHMAATVTCSCQQVAMCGHADPWAPRLLLLSVPTELRKRQPAGLP
jgi:hypothetical protein